MLHLLQNTMPVENERGNEKEINNTGKKKKKPTQQNHTVYIDEIVLLVQVNTIFMTGSKIEAIDLLNSIS